MACVLCVAGLNDVSRCFLLPWLDGVPSCFVPRGLGGMSSRFVPACRGAADVVLTSVTSMAATPVASRERRRSSVMIDSHPKIRHDDYSGHLCQILSAGCTRRLSAPRRPAPPVESGEAPFERAFWARMTVLAVQETGKHGGQHRYNLLLVSYHE